MTETIQTQYNVLVSTGLMQLVEQVEMNIALGWVPQGGVAVTPDRLYLQAMTKPERVREV